MATFPERLRELREERDLSQTELAQELGVAMNTVSIWERGERQPRDDLFFKIAEFFDVPFTYLAGVSDRRDWPVLSDEEAAEVAEAEQKEIEFHMMKLYQDLSDEMQHMIRAMVAEAYREEKRRGKLASQQRD